MKPGGPVLCIVAVALIAPSYLRSDDHLVGLLQQWPGVRIPLGLLLFGLGVGLMLRLPVKAPPGPPPACNYAEASAPPSALSGLVRLVIAATIMVLTCFVPGFLLAIGHDPTLSAVTTLALMPISVFIGALLAGLFLWATRPRRY